MLGVAGWPNGRDCCRRRQSRTKPRHIYDVRSLPHLFSGVHLLMDALARVANVASEGFFHASLADSSIIMILDFQEDSAAFMEASTTYMQASTAYMATSITP